MTILYLFTALLTKHFVVDFLLQNKYQWSNKGTYGHMGGILHAGLHGVSTWLIFFWVSPFSLMFGLFDAIIHYHVDWAKMNLNSKLGYSPTNSEKFWWLLGLDQYLHQLTYIGMLIFYSKEF